MTTSTSEADPAARARAVKAKALEIGFDVVGVAPAAAPPSRRQSLEVFIEAGRHGDMTWMAERLAARADPVALWPAARSVVMVGLNYGPDSNPLEILAQRDLGAISVYARGDDYHDVVKPRLKTLGRWMIAQFGGSIKVFVDTAPVMEKPLAAAAGLGWQGKHTNLVSRARGSWLFLGAVFADFDLETDHPEVDHCGACRRCLDICPTRAFPKPHQLDARRCVSYLTIEHKGPIPEEFRAAIGNRIYGCDDCLAVCPWNKFAETAREARLAARAENEAPPLRDLVRLDDAGFRARFRGTPIKRIGRDRFVRNVLIAIGNSGDASLAPEAAALMQDASPVVRDAAEWALSRLGAPAGAAINGPFSGADT